MRVLVCGGRDLYEQDAFEWLRDHAIMALRKANLDPLPRADMIIHGDAKGADKAADRWGRSLGLIVVPCPADWDRWKKRAGPIRNTQMLKRFEPDVTIALPGNTGTGDMITKSLAKGVPVIKVERLTGMTVKVLRRGEPEETIVL
jgi:hypothetical protein